MEQITSIVEQITHWGLTGIWKILFAIIIWFVGKKVIALCMKFLKKVFDLQVGHSILAASLVL